MEKKLGLLVSVLAFASVAFAQDKTAIQYKNEGQEFFKEKKYQQALESYQNSIALQGDSLDGAVVFNAAYCAQSVKNYEVALDYFGKSEELGYKKAESAFYKAMVYKVQKMGEEYEKAVEYGFNTYKNGKTGNAFKKEYAKIFRDKAYALYNACVEDTKAMQTASGDKLNELKAAALAKTVEAKPLIEKSLEINPDDANAKTIRDGIEKQMAALK